MFVATKVLITLDSLMLILALIGFCYSISVVSLGGKLCLDCLAIPIEWGWTAFGLTLGIVLVSILAIIAAAKHIKTLLIFMSLFTFITFGASVALTVIILLWSTATDLGVLQGTIQILEEQLKSFLAVWAIQHPIDWIGLQSNLDCCGVDIKSVYDHPDWETTLNTGIACNDTVDGVIKQYTIDNPVYNLTEPQVLVFYSTINGGAVYFCETSARALAKQYTVIVGIVLGFLSFFQLIAFSLSMYLICGVKPEDGGYANVDENGKIESPLRALVNAPQEMASDTRQFAKRVSMQVGMGVAPVANRVSTRMGFAPVFNTSNFTPISSPPPGMPPPGMNGFGKPPPGPPPGISPVMKQELGSSGAPKEWGEQYAKYVRMKKSGLPIGAVRNAMERDQIPIPDGFFDEEGGESTPSSSGPPKRFGAPPPGPPPFQAVKNFAHRMSTNVKDTRQRVSMNMKGLFGGGFAPPPPPPGFGELPPDGGIDQFGGARSFGGSTDNPYYKAPPSGIAKPIPEEFPAIAAPPPAAAPKKEKPAPKPKPVPAPKPTPAPKPAKAATKKVENSGGGGGGAPSALLGDISGGGFKLKKTVTNDRSGPNLNLM